MSGRSFHDENTGKETSAAVDSRGRQVTHLGLHREIHEGETYSCGHLFEAVADDAVADLLIQIGSTKKSHFTFNNAAGGDSYVTLAEDVIVSNSGTVTSVPNKNRSSANTPDTNLWHTPTVVSVGTTLFSGLLPGGTGGNSVGGATAERDEWILDLDKFYLLRVTNKGGNAKDISSQATFYEES